MLPAKTARVGDTGGDSTPDEDQGVIRCICNIDDDDGFTIQCENCLVWQHAVCVKVDQDNVPDEYLCEKCNPRKLDVKRAVDYQKRRLDSESRHVKEARKRPKYVGGKVKRADDSSERRKRAADFKAPRTKAPRPGANRESSSPTPMNSGERSRDTVVLPDHSYTLIERNILGADVQVLFHSVLSQMAEQQAGTASGAASGALGGKAAVSSPPVGTSTLSGPAGRHEGDRQTPPAISSMTEAAHTNGKCSDPEMADDAMSRSAMVAMTDDEMSRSAPVYRGFARDNRGQIGLFARELLAQGRYVCEYRGQVLLKAAYKEDPKNYYELLRTTRPHSHFHPEIDLCVDARRQGSEARFVRRSCDANVALKSIYVPGSPDSLIHLGLFATRDVLADEELTVGWEWDEGELPAVARMQPADASDYLDRPEGRRMSKVWRQAFGGITCACADTQCSVRRLFAMHGVEETAARPDAIGAGIKRRASRPHRIDTGGSGGGSDPQLSSPDGAKEARASHSRKGSVAGAGATNGDSGANGHGRGALGSTQQVGVYGDCNGEGDGGGSSDDSSRAANRRGASSSSSSNKSRSRSQSRKRKPSGPSAEPAVRATSPVASSDGCRKQRSASGTPVPWKASSPPPCSLPLKKLWMSQYLELTESRADNQGALVAPAASMGIGTPMDTGDVTMADVGTNAEASPVAHVDANAEAKPMAEHTATPLSGLSEPPKSDGVAGSEAPVAADQSVVRSLPTDADAPTPSPTGASLSAPADVDEAPEALSASSLGQASEGPTDSPVACAISEGVPPSVAPAAPKPAAAKKQRLSLEEYNKRRRGNTATPTGADIDADGEGAAPRPAADEPTHAAPMPGRALQSASPATLGSAPSISDGAVQSAAPATPISAPPVLAPVAVGPRPPLTGSSLERDHRRRDASRERESGEIARTYRPPVPHAQRSEIPRTFRPLPPSASASVSASVSAPGFGSGPGSGAAPSRALSMSPGPYQHAPDAFRGAPRRAGLGPGGSRGGSPSRK